MTRILRPDLCVIGGGPGGLAAARAAAGLGAKVVLVEKRIPANGEHMRFAWLSQILAATAASRVRTGMGETRLPPDFKMMRRACDAAMGRFAREDSPARLTGLNPGIVLERHDIAEPAQRAGVEERLKAWVSAHLEGVLAPILPLRAIGNGEASASGPVRAVVFRLHEDGGALPRASVAAHLKALTKADRQQFKTLGVRLGPQDVFLPRLLKPGPARLKALLWRLATGAATPDVAAGRVSLAAPDGFSEAAWRWAGYRLIAGHAIRIDALDRLVTDLIRREQDGFIVAGPELAATLGLKAEAFSAVMAALGYQGAEREVTGFERAPRKAPRRRPRRETAPSGACENRPLAILADLQKQARKGSRS